MNLRCGSREVDWRSARLDKDLVRGSKNPQRKLRNRCGGSSLRLGRECALSTGHFLDPRLFFPTCSITRLSRAAPVPTRSDEGSFRWRRDNVLERLKARLARIARELTSKSRGFRDPRYSQGLVVFLDARDDKALPGRASAAYNSIIIACKITFRKFFQPAKWRSRSWSIAMAAVRR